MKLSLLIRYTFFMCFLALLNSCFEVVEQVSFNADGSGNMKLILNMSQSKTKLQSVMLMDKVNGHKVPKQEEIEKEIKELVAIAKGVKGITNVNSSPSFKDFIFSFSCDFANTDALNELVYTIRKAKDKTSFQKEKYVHYNASKKQLERNFTFIWGDKYDKLTEKDKEVLKDATYTAIYKYPSEVKSVSNAKAKISSNKKATMLQIKAMDIITKKATIQNYTQF